MSDETPVMRPALPVGAIPSRQPAPIGISRTPHEKVEDVYADIAKRAYRGKRAKKAKPRKVGKRKELAAPYPAPARNPNRPLELRNQMDAMLAVVDTLRRPELAAFKVAMQALAPLSRKARKAIVAALASVYP